MAAHQTAETEGKPESGPAPESGDAKDPPSAGSVLVRVLKVEAEARVPAYQSAGAAGLDVCAWFPDDGPRTILGDLRDENCARWLARELERRLGLLVHDVTIGAGPASNVG